MSTPTATNSLDTYRNQKLAPLLNRVTGSQVAAPVGPGLGVSAADRMRAGEASQNSLQGLQDVQDAATRQHQLRLAAIKKQQQARQAAVSAPSGAYAPTGGQGGMGGPWGLTGAATQALQAMSAAYQQRWGTPLVVNSGGRSREEQARAYQAYLEGRGNLAAPPGHSVHESGRAADFGGAILNAGSAQHIWLQQNAARFGWTWTGKNFSQFEPWHWEYTG